ncbi:MAG TPA: ATP-binding protein [Magnetococcales bacterium]|nr:ATP-binding protein [Magnetococcales bacterium]
MEKAKNFVRKEFSESVAEDWWRDASARLHWLRQRPILGKPSGIPDVFAINRDYLAGLPAVTKEMGRNFLRGGLPDFAIVQAGIPVRLGVVQRGISLLEQHRALLLEGAAGTGKTTALIQIGLELFNLHPKARVYWIDSSQADPSAIFARKETPIILMIDRADQSRSLERLLGYVAKHHPLTRVVMAARSNEWREFINETKFSRSNLQHLVVPHLEDSEFEILAQKINEYEAADNAATPAMVTQRLRQENAKDLLAAMILATRGRPFREIMSDLVAKLLEHPNGKELAAILAVVAGMETRRDPKNRTHPATLTLLRETFRYSRDRLNFAMSHLKGELTLVQRNRKTGAGGRFLFQEVHTRHPVIAETLWKILATDPGAPIHSEKLDIAVFKGAAAACNMGRTATPERTFTATLLETRAKEGPVEAARRLFFFIPKYSPGNPVLWQIWALFEKNQDNLGSREEEYTARWLFERAVNADPKHAPVWQAWAILEKEQNNIGARNLEFSARWLFERAVNADQKNAQSWQAWAILEKEQNNIGARNLEFSARWLFERAVNADPKDAQSWQAWAILEKEQNNIGARNLEFSARWLFERAVNADPKHAPVWQAWAILEKEQNNIGARNLEFSAQWLFERAKNA